MSSTSQYIHFNPNNLYYVQSPLMTNTNAQIANPAGITNIAVSSDVTDANSYYNIADKLNFYPDNKISSIIQNTGMTDVCDYVNTTSTRNSVGDILGKNGVQYYNKALCDNYKLATELDTTTSTTLSSGQLYTETKSQYSRELLMSINICIGIIGCGVFIYFNK